MSEINVLSRTQKIEVLSGQQRIVVLPDNTVQVLDPGSAISVVNAGPVGPPGVQGPVGPEGPEGPVGPTASAFTWVQSISASQWYITHNLGYFPNVAIVDSSGKQVMTDITYLDANSLRSDAAFAFSGKAHLS